MKITHLTLLLTSLAIGSSAFGQGVVNVLDDFESFSLGTQSANNMGTFAIVDASSTIGSGQAAQFHGVQAWHGFDWDQSTNPNPVLTVSFDFYNPSAVTEASSPSFAFNNSGVNPINTSRNIIRLGLNGDGTISFAGDPGTPTYSDQNYPMDTLVGMHLVFNNSATEVTYDSGRILGPNSIDAWKEIGGTLSLVGTQQFTPAALDYLIFGTASTYTAGDLLIDNMRYTEGVTVVPEPSTYAALLGLVALVGVAIRRRLK